MILIYPDVDIYTISEEPKVPYIIPVDETFVQSISLLPNMPLKTLRTKLIKALKARPTAKIRVFARLRQDTTTAGIWGEIDLTDSRRSDLTWWGVENGGHLGILLP